MGQFDSLAGGFPLVGQMYAHGDEIKFHTASKVYNIASSSGAGSTAWADITGTPTTLAGYGITDAASDAELATHAADTTAVHGVADTSALVVTTDPRLTDARTPTVHATSHQNGGADEISVAGLSGLLADAQTPLSHSILTHSGFPGGTTDYLRADGSFATPPTGGITDGDKGDITVSGSGANWALDNDVVTYAKMQNVSATDRLIGRSTAGAGDPEEIPCTAFARTILDDADAATVRTTIGAGTSSFNGAYGSLSGIPATFAPSAHATSHQNGGGDELNVGGLNGVLADPQPPIIGAGAAQAVAGNDARLTNARTPTAHAGSHMDGGSDQLNVDGLIGVLADPQTPATHNILTAHNGFPGGTATFLRADGAFASPTASVAISEANIAFTDGDTMRRVTISDASVTTSSKIVGSIRRPDSTDDSVDSGYMYIHNVVEVVNGGFDLLVACLDWGYDDPTQNPPNETVKFQYTFA